ncbi:MAG TPA: amidohydrolase [Sutterella sp.]|nr:amidohydrolase [Sutterella sp.]
MFDLILRNARVVDPLNGLDAVADVAVEAGKIAQVSPEISGKANQEYDFSGYVIQPGIIDSHVHLGTMWGSPYGHRMLALQAVTTCLDMAGPMDDILDKLPEYGAGLNVGILQFASPPYTFKNTTPSKAEMIELIESALAFGTLGVKLMGGHYPLTPDISSLLIKTALERRAYVAWHAGTTEHGSNIEGMLEAVDMADGHPLHLAHINAYCRGAIRPEMQETREAIDKLVANPNVFCESYVSPKNGTRLACDAQGKIISKVTGNCLRRFGFSEDVEGVQAAFLAGRVFAVYDAGGVSDLMTGREGLEYWLEMKTDVGGSFNVNPPLPRIELAQAKRPDGSFVVDAISTDGGCIPRNVILSQGLSLVKLDILSLSEFVIKTSLNPARMLRLENKGHLSVGADADLSVYDFASQRPKAAFVDGRPIMLDGKILGKAGNVICTERGKDAIAARGFKAIVTDPGIPYGPRYIPR